MILALGGRFHAFLSSQPGVSRSSVIRIQPVSTDRSWDCVLDLLITGITQGASYTQSSCKWSRTDRPSMDHSYTSNRSAFCRHDDRLVVTTKSIRRLGFADNLRDTSHPF
jgi:hypothetical protein